MKGATNLTERDLQRKPICRRCSKVVFDGKKAARTKANWLMRRGIERRLRVYPCPAGAGWHLTKIRNHQYRSRRYGYEDT